MDAAPSAAAVRGGTNDGPLAALVTELPDERPPVVLLDEGRGEFGGEPTGHKPGGGFREAGVNLRLHSWFSRPIVDNGVMKGVICETKSGPQAFMADIARYIVEIIDAIRTEIGNNIEIFIDARRSQTASAAQ